MASFFTTLVQLSAAILCSDHWSPNGFLSADEARLGETPGFLDAAQRAEVTNWWLARPGTANTPNWDLMCRFSQGGRDGLILVEAKAHEAEMRSHDDASGAEGENAARIDAAPSEASAGWNALLPGFTLGPHSHYQLSNRFAFAWKLASMKVPVVLMYLGFLNAEEMRTRLFRDHAAWRACVLEQSKGVIPAAAWDSTFDVNGTPLTVLIRSAEVRIEATTNPEPGR